MSKKKSKKLKKAIASERKKKASSTNLVIADSNESAQAESTQAEIAQAESTQTESPQETYPTTPTTESHQYVNYCTCDSCIECNKDVGYEKCNEHNTPATPEHMQLHLN